MDPRATSTDVSRDAEVDAKLARSIELPLAALRASLESLNESLPGKDPLGGVIEEVLRIGTNVRKLVDFTYPPQPEPVRCTASEITYSAIRALAPEHRERVLLARVAATGDMHTDPGLLTGSLRRIIENALEATSENVLLTVRQGESETVFSVIDGAAETFDIDRAIVAFRSTKQNHLGLGLALTQRDVALVGGSLRMDRTDLGDTCVVVTVPNHFAPNAAA